MSWVILLFDSVERFLSSKRTGRPHTFEEICLNVSKARSNVWRELNSLLLYGDVRVIRLKFNNRDCNFYTFRDNVVVKVLSGADEVIVSEGYDFT